jgi:hypothetical protein
MADGEQVLFVVEGGVSIFALSCQSPNCSARSFWPTFLLNTFVFLPMLVSLDCDQLAVLVMSIEC